MSNTAVKEIYPATTATDPIKVGFISLGCAKNLIDSEIMIGHLTREGMAITPDATLADVLVVNTCSFIDVAKQESVDAIYEAVGARLDDPTRERQKIIVAGCLTQRFRKELPTIMPEVDALMGLDQLEQIPAIVREVMGVEINLETSPLDHTTAAPKYIPDYDTPRFRLTPNHYTYIKIAEGCNHPCTFCIIPKIRGAHRSRTQESVVKEARRLVQEGVKEINLISQDTTYFGMDRWTDSRPNPRSPVDSQKGESLATLIRELNKIEGDFWIRLLYTHPAHWSDELIAAIAESPKVARYIDIPLQHIADNMLDKMKRETDGGYIRDLIARIRAGIPGVGIRTTFIVGFPGETDADFDELLTFIEQTRFERAGVFTYSKEENTRAYKLPEHRHHMTKKSRRDRAMAALQRIAEEQNKSLVGKTMRVLVESPGIARTEWDAPEIDGTVLVDKALPVGEFAQVTIQDWRGYDLVAAK